MSLAINNTQRLILFYYYINVSYFSLQIASTSDPDVFNIIFWDEAVVGDPEPTEASQINALATTPRYFNNYAIYQRQNGPHKYLPIQQQLSMLYEDMKNDTNYFAQHIGEVEYLHYPLDGVSKPVPSVSSPATDDEIPVVPVIPTNTAADRKLVMASMSTTQAISGTNKVTINFDGEQVDAADAFADNIFVAPVDGYYEIVAYVQVENAAIVSLLNAYLWSLSITQSGSVGASYTLDGYTHAILGAIPYRLQGTKVLKLVAGDNIILQVQKALSSSLNISGGYLNIHKICDL